MTEFALTAYQAAFVDDLTTVDVRFLVVGGVALRAHGVFRATRDLDILVERTKRNATRLLPVLARRFRNTPAALTIEWLMTRQKRLSLPSELENEVDILTSLGALDFTVAFSKRCELTLEARRLPALGLAELIYSKAVSADTNDAPAAKERDAADFAALVAVWDRRRR